ncbi:MAG: hypothetical protein TRG1_870 [Flavobacteriaceae bacterium FS1-H7996/R]|nr:MAG: hypothetical protein TRG1_870 [Flavobacteriaceae bacterium FS1-H7996/R]
MKQKSNNWSNKPKQHFFRAEIEFPFNALFTRKRERIEREFYKINRQIEI